MINASVGILTLNSSKSLFKCLNSVKYFNEIIIFDGGSTDSTLNIAKKFKCRILKQNKKYQFFNKKIKDFSSLRNELIKNSKFNLVLMLDSDEIISNNCIKFIDFISKSTIHRNKYYCYLIPRMPKIENVYYKQSNLFPEFQPRLFNKSKFDKYVKLVHETPFPINKKYKKLKIKDITIQFNAMLKETKYKYYFEIEKIMLRNKFFMSLKFIFFRILVNMKKLYKCIFFKKSNKAIANFEGYTIKKNLKYSFKLLFYKLTFDLFNE